MNRFTSSAFKSALALFVLVTALVWVSPRKQLAECEVQVTLLQVNDVYQFAPVEQGARGGLARLSTLKKAIQKDNANTLFLLAGDTISPSVESITYKGAQMIEAWNAAGLDYATFGNHEFDFGPDTLKQRIQESKFGWLAANVIDKKTQQPFGGSHAYVIREFKGVKVGIFGLVLQETQNTSRPGPDVEFRDPCDTAKQMVSEIHQQGVRVVVALTHLPMNEDKKVARCSGVNLIIGGHEHTLLESSAGGAPIFKMTSDARDLGQIDLNISQTTGELNSIDWKVIPVTNETQEDPAFAVVYRKYSGLLTQLAKPVGRTSVPLDARSAENRTRETNVGNLVADAFRKAMAADVSLINGGSIRADGVLGRGQLTMRDVLSILPFKNRLIKISVSGATLRAAIENGVSRSAEELQPGGFPQVSGIKFSFDASRPAGTRVIDLTINGSPLDNSRKYSVATTTFIALDGGDGYAMLKGAQVLLPPDRAPFDYEALQRAITVMRTVKPRVENRIVRLDHPIGSNRDCDK